MAMARHRGHHVPHRRRPTGFGFSHGPWRGETGAEFVFTQESAQTATMTLRSSEATSEEAKAIASARLVPLLPRAADRISPLLSLSDDVLITEVGGGVEFWWCLAPAMLTSLIALRDSSLRVVRFLAVLISQR